mmetsp:Transcript_22237/g.66763  ORF Transcript_22237/g.66763 Transcript_22237/m.66763 type:complete len:747 (+) Transcript_22237:58-2298(+)
MRTLVVALLAQALVARALRAPLAPWRAAFRPSALQAIGRYCADDKAPERRATSDVKVGQVTIGSANPIVLQTMGTTDTNDVDASVAQILRCQEAGADMVRLTVQGIGEAKKSLEIREKLDARGARIPLVADIHFNVKASLIACEAYDKIRVNPGNFADGRKTFKEIDYDDPAEFIAERDYIEETFTPLVLKCKELGRAMRIGTNHGSLSARIMSFYGDSAEGMVESALEFANICRKLDFHNFVFSMKASNPVVMVQAYRLLAAKQYELGWDYPLHLGVTEAGEGEDGRMKSAIGIGTLLSDGLGDTIRVSLTEDPEYEYEPCNRLAELAEAELGEPARARHEAVPAFVDGRDVTTFDRRRGALPEQREGDEMDYRGLLHRDGSVYGALSLAELQGCSALGGLGDSALFRALGAKVLEGPGGGAALPQRDIATVDAIFLREPPAADDAASLDLVRRLQSAQIHFVVPAGALAAAPEPLRSGGVPLVACSDLEGAAAFPSGRMAVLVTGGESDAQLRYMESRAAEIDVVMLDVDPAISRLHASRRLFAFLREAGSELSVVHHVHFADDLDRSELALNLGMQAGALLGDGLGDGLLVEPDAVDAVSSGLDLAYLRETSFALLQGSRMRNTKTEFVSCPSCGRTLFDLQEVTAQIAERTGHLPGVAIAIMGCIVNGPGEMADADFGYVGGAPGKVDLYVGKEVVQKAIPNDDACDALVELIKEHGMWKDKEEEPEEEAVEEESEEMALSR